MDSIETETPLSTEELSSLRWNYLITILSCVMISTAALALFFLPPFFLLLVKASWSTGIVFVLFGIPTLLLVANFSYRSISLLRKDLRLRLKVRYIGLVKDKETKRIRDVRLPWKSRWAYFITLHNRGLEVNKEVFNQVYPGDEICIEILPHSGTVFRFWYLNPPFTLDEDRI